MSQPLYQQLEPIPDRRPGPDPPAAPPPDRRSWGGWIVVIAVAATIVIATTYFLSRGGPELVEEVAVADVAKDGSPSAARAADASVSLSGEVDEILTESALTVTDGRGDESLLVLLAPTTIVNGNAPTLGGQPGGIVQALPPEGEVQFIGTVDTFDAATLAERLGIVLNGELFAPWQGDPVLVAQQIDTFDPDADTGTGSG